MAAFPGGLAILGAATLLAPGLAAAAELSIEFPSLDQKGAVSVAVFATPEAWSSREEPAFARTTPVTEGQVRLKVSLPPGDYAVMAYHDRNANGRLDTLPIGLPTEPYGFSNNSRGTFGPPRWRAAVFRLGEDGARQVIRLR